MMSSVQAFVAPHPVVRPPLAPLSSHQCLAPQSSRSGQFASKQPVSAPSTFSGLSRDPVRATATAPTSPTGSSAASAKASAPAASSRGTFDYIIVGGGAAGCVLANRLSINPDVRVLLLETGPPSASFLVNTPLGFPKLLGSSLDAAFTTEPEPLLDGRRLYFPRGRCLGGSHAISVMLYHRGHPYDYNVWAAAAGDEWGPEEVLPYFMRSQTQTASDKAENTAQHGSSGPLPVSDLRCVNPMSAAFVDAAVSQGLGSNPDFNDWSTDQAGAGLFQVTQQNGNRATPASAYLAPATLRKNLTVMSGTTVSRILFDRPQSAPPVAVGVELVDEKGQHKVMRASREVILSAGVYGSPQLLMLSGIGPGDHLSSHGIPVLVDSPSVGQNLQDHAAAMVSFQSPSPYTDKRFVRTYYTDKLTKDPRVVLQYLLNGKGPLTSPMCEAGAFVRTKPDLDACDLQLRFIPFVSEPDPYESLSGYANSGSYFRNNSNRPAGFSLQSVVARPQSRGFVQLRSCDVQDGLAIHPNWISDDRDLDTLVSGIKLCRQIAGSDAFGPYRGEELHPGPDSSDDAALREYVRASCHTANAMVGTCAMGKDGRSVTDAQLRVRGVKGLRVIDSSVMPTLPGGQSGAPTMMVAEKGADFVLAAGRTAQSTSATAG